jgi:putative N6-adenine-specific DNA methylase
MFVSCPGGLEELLVQEMQEMGLDARKSFRGVFVPKTLQNVYKINYGSRLATRVLWPLAEFACKNRDDLYAGAKKVDWKAYLNLGKTFAIDANVEHPLLRNSLFAAQVMKDAICDQLRESLGSRPSVDVKNPDIQLHLFIHKNRAQISFDTSGTPLYKRGWRKESVVAPLQESLAVALLKITGFQGELCDPFCGSGTFLIEAAMMATQTPAGFFRKSWGLVHMPEHNPKEWLRFRQEENRKIIPLPAGKIFGADKDPRAVALAQAHIKTTQFPIEVVCSDIQHFSQPAPFILTNPPYGKRLASSSPDINILLSRFSTSQIAFLSSSSYPLKEAFSFSNGGLQVTLYINQKKALS